MNKVVLTGRLTKDPELRFTPGNGTAVASFSIAVRRSFKTEGQPDADFINCVAFGKRAETIAQYFTKGKLIGVSGSIRTGSYDAKDGTKRYTTDIMVEEFDFLESGNGSTKTPASSGNSEFGMPSSFGNDSYDMDMTPVDDGDIPF